VRVVLAPVVSPATGAFHVAGEGSVTVPEIAQAPGRRTLAVPAHVLGVEVAPPERCCAGMRRRAGGSPSGVDWGAQPVARK
jgi:hypothetical protein